MLLPEHQVTISEKHQSYLKTLNTNINEGETVAWSVIKTAYKKRVLVVHPDKGGSKETFDEVNTAFQKLERLIEHGTEFEFDGLAETSSSLDEMLNELPDKIKAKFDRMNDRMDASFNKMNDSLDRMTARLEELHTTFEETRTTLKTGFSKINESLDRLETHTDKIEAKTKSMVANIPFYVGCYSVFLGSIISIISNNHQLQNERSSGDFVFGAGLIITGSYLVANSLFKKEPSTSASENKEQRAELK